MRVEEVLGRVVPISLLVCGPLLVMKTSADSASHSNNRLYQKVAEQIARVISEGEYPPGSRLPAERRLAERFNVSRPTVREAIIALEIAGCVEVRGGSGVYVSDGNLDRFASTELDVGPFDILEARALFEGSSAELAASRITDEEIAKLEEAIEAMVLENEGEPGHEEADGHFHLLIAKATKNEAMVAICRNLWELRNSSPVSARILEKVRQSGSRPRIDEHTAILNALKLRDPVGAKAAMRQHLTQVIQQLLDATEAVAVEDALSKIRESRDRFSKIG